MPTYQELKDELKSISSLIENYPEDLKPKVFDLLIHEFFDGDLPNLLKGNSTQSKQSKLKSIDLGNGKAEETQVRTTSVKAEEFPEFVKSCNNASSAGKKNLLIVFYHEMVAKTGPVAEDEIKRKYKEMGWKPNQNFHQSILDTKNKNGWIYKIDEGDSDHNSTGWLTTHQGAAFVKDELLDD